MHDLLMISLVSMWLCYFGAIISPVVTGKGLNKIMRIALIGTVAIFSLEYFL